MYSIVHETTEAQERKGFSRGWAVLAGLAAVSFLILGRPSPARPQAAELELLAFAPPETTPAIDRPRFVERAAADAFMKDDEPVLGVELGGRARAYSIWQLERRLVVNDEILGRAIAVTWCPFSHTAVVYQRQVGGRTLTFESSGKLLHGALVLRDRETGTLWAQADGATLEGPLAGSPRLRPMAALQAAWKVWKEEQPKTVVLEKTGGDREIAASQYAGYYADPKQFGTGGVEMKVPRFPGKALVVGVVLGNERVAVSMERLRRLRVISFVADHQTLAAIYDPKTETARVVRTEARGTALSMRARPDKDFFGQPWEPALVDEQTASTWDFTGQATFGKMKGHRLPLAPHRVQFWYAWQAYFPQSRVE